MKFNNLGHLPKGEFLVTHQDLMLFSGVCLNALVDLGQASWMVSF